MLNITCSRVGYHGDVCSDKVSHKPKSCSVVQDSAQTSSNQHQHLSFSIRPLLVAQIFTFPCFFQANLNKTQQKKQTSDSHTAATRFTFTGHNKERNISSTPALYQMVTLMRATLNHTPLVTWCKYENII